MTRSPPPARVAFPGERGAYSEDAVSAIWPDAEAVPARYPLDVAHAVVAGAVDAGVLPVENTLAGSVVASYDALAQCGELHAVAERVIRIRHCLLGSHGATIDGIELVESHPVALAQCTAFLARHPRIEIRAATDTGRAALDIAQAGDPRRAAIAGLAAATRYGLSVLASGIEDRPDNQTRFLAVSRTPAVIATGTAARTSLVFTTPNDPGALVRALTPLANHKLNLSKLESRPTGEPWTYRFFADVEHDAGDAAHVLTLRAMCAATQTLRVLGTYARQTS
ncbi:MAG: prephenate dehydratase [Gemmatimonadaceae bacterium]